MVFWKYFRLGEDFHKWTLKIALYVEFGEFMLEFSQNNWIEFVFE